MTELASVSPAVQGVEKPLRCIRCDVTWRGTSADACWNCGVSGVPLGNVRIVEDEPAA